MSETKWTEQTCFIAAKQCNSLSDFSKRFSGAYKVAKLNGWLEDYKWFTNPRSKWNRTSCYEAARQCATTKEFNKRFNRAYQVARLNGWLETYNWLRTNGSFSVPRGTKKG
jgi:hypothetical protein